MIIILCPFLRHEPPVTDNPLEIIELTDDLVVLNKPSSIPVSSCRKCNGNSLGYCGTMTCIIALLVLPFCR